MKAVCLLSGGLDSATACAVACQGGFEVTALTVNYGQRHYGELLAAQRIAKHFGAEQIVTSVELARFGGSALTDVNAKVPRAPGIGIPPTYVPGRNIVFLALAASLAEAIDADAVYLGVNVIDYSGYPDCRPTFLDAFRKVLGYGTKRGDEGRPVKIHAPLINMPKVDIVRLALKLDVPLAETRSCYDLNEDGVSCGCCDSCRIRLAAFAEAGVEDPIPYVPNH